MSLQPEDENIRLAIRETSQPISSKGDTPPQEAMPEATEATPNPSTFACKKKDAEVRTARKEATQRTLVGIEIKPYDVEQDLMALWKNITTEIKQEGLKWGQNCTLVPVAYGIKKIQTTFTMGVNNSSDDVQDAITEAYEEEVQSVEITTMNAL